MLGSILGSPILGNYQIIRKHTPDTNVTYGQIDVNYTSDQRLLLTYGTLTKPIGF